MEINAHTPRCRPPPKASSRLRAEDEGSMTKGLKVLFSKLIGLEVCMGSYKWRNIFPSRPKSLSNYSSLACQ